MPDSPQVLTDDPIHYYGSAFAIGVAAAGVMTLAGDLAQRAGWTTFDLPMTLGTVTAFADTPSPGAWFQGFIAVLLCGGVFALAYAWLFELLGPRGPRAWRGVLIGFAHAAIGGALLAVVTPALHAPMPDHPLLADPGFMAANYGSQTALVFLGLHILFGAIVGAWLHYAPVTRNHLAAVWQARHPGQSPGRPAHP